MNELTHIDLFTGIGGFALAARWTGFRTVVFCEKNEWCQKILAKNFRAEVVSNADKCGLQKQGAEQQASGVRQLSEDVSDEKIPIIPDIHDFDGTKRRDATLLTGGFPCQPFSCAGKRGGTADDRYLWPEMVRVIAEAKPDWVIGENVRGIVTMELDRVLSDLEGIGYTCWPVIIPACAVDAKHRRDRVWIVAHSQEPQQRNLCGERSDIPGQGETQLAGIPGHFSAGSPDVANTISQRGCLWTTNRADASDAGQSPCTWQNEAEWFAKSGMGRVAHGIPHRVDRLKGLGNAIVPQVAAELMRMIITIEQQSQPAKEG